jgi:hypothetical protein
MTIDAWQTEGTASDAKETAANHAREIYEHLLALSNQVGGAYVEAYERTAAGIGDLQRKLASAGFPDWFEPGSGWQAGTPFGDISEPLEKAAARALEMSEKLSERSKEVTLAYLNACEAAALAVADWQEEVAATSPLELMQTVGGMQAALTREMSKASGKAAREMLNQLG